MAGQRDQHTESDEDGAPNPVKPLAVALRYDLDPAKVPKVVASGRGAIADNIMAAARAAGVEVRSDADLAALLSTLDIGDDIPAEAFVAVAEVLRYVYQVNGKLRQLERNEEAEG